MTTKSRTQARDIFKKQLGDVGDEKTIYFAHLIDRERNRIDFLFFVSPRKGVVQDVTTTIAMLCNSATCEEHPFGIDFDYDDPDDVLYYPTLIANMLARDVYGKPNAEESNIYMVRLL